LRATKSLNSSQLPDDVASALGSRYSDITYISSGATASVFSALDSNLDKRVAIKVLRHIDERGLISFQKEAKSAAKLDHPNLVSILNFGKTHKNRAYLIMSFVDGKSLDEIIEQKGRLPLPVALNLLIQICDGLTSAHAKRIAHRDLKTSNIMVQNFETEPLAVIVDFGLAKDQDQEISRTDTGAAIGSPLFMSPEQAQGRVGDEGSDIYALACIAFRMIAGETPFYSEDVFDLLRQHIHEQPARLSELAPAWEIPDQLDCLLDSMLSKNPKERPQSVSEVKDNLIRIQLSLETKPESTARGTRAESTNRNQVFTILRVVHAVLPVVAVGGILAAAFGLAAFVLHDPQSNAAKAASGLRHSKQSANSETPKDDIALIRIKPMTEKPKKISNYFHPSGDADYMERTPKRHYTPYNSTLLRDEDLICFQNYTYKNERLPLSLNRTSITGTGLKYLHTPNLKVLDLSATKLTDAGFAELVKLDNIEKLALQDTDMTIDRIRKLKKMKNLHSLYLDNCKNIRDETVVELCRFPKLKFLSLGVTGITKSGIKMLSGCRTLEALVLNSTPCDDQCAEELLELPNLKELQVNDCPGITDKTVAMVARKKGTKMKSLGLSGTKTTRATVALLASCPNLQELNLGGIPLTDSDLEVISKLKKLESLQLSHTKASDEAIYRTLLSLRKLTQTGILYSNMSEKTEARIRAALPKCALMTECINASSLRDKDKDPMEFITSSQSEL
jgi:tRNA A-37 threonylcarbamoyl transferase component Bud32